MKTLTLIYWIRFGLGIAAAALCTFYNIFAGSLTRMDVRVFFSGFSLALLFYLATYYIIKIKFLYKVDKPSKLVTTGIGIYFFSWIVFWVLFYTLLRSG
jgi:hypothetical protein